MGITPNLEPRVPNVTVGLPSVAEISREVILPSVGIPPPSAVQIEGQLVQDAAPPKVSPEFRFR